MRPKLCLGGRKRGLKRARDMRASCLIHFLRRFDEYIRGYIQALHELETSRGAHRHRGFINSGGSKLVSTDFHFSKASPTWSVFHACSGVGVSASAYGGRQRGRAAIRDARRPAPSGLLLGSEERPPKRQAVHILFNVSYSRLCRMCIHILVAQCSGVSGKGWGI